ncbi:hypothetical protein DEA8626_02505 [Defluviimonas aquaemixtae]|uniref:Flagella basal body P-ring formation protein FlgA n=1 Tax=Albidovulum aquaemixtae TaxID=1542388 RepID=A0A2R8BJF9_9RHOB|nr:flagellar basal body P-ring formation chaperone FlgA [Defluviimonas aquaemixtae]SPH23442.1 hypothetical protein DEA8626_02505 [Defluviimonas aquaemixtae]
MRALVSILVGTLAMPAFGETLVAARTLRAQTVLAPDDFVVSQTSVPGTASDATTVIGQETRVAIYQGRPIRLADIGPPALVDRNQIVVLSYVSGTLSIRAEGRVLDRGGVGDTVRVMNVASRTTITGVVAADGSVRAQRHE